MDTQDESARREEVAAKLVWQSPVLTKESIEAAEVNVGSTDDGFGLS